MSVTYSLPNLSPDMSRDILDTLIATLPHPDINTPENYAARDEAAIAAVAALAPANIIEAHMAIMIVAADASARDCLRLADLPGTDERKCRKVGASMARQVEGLRRDLRRYQASRVKAEAATPPATGAGSARNRCWVRKVPAPSPGTGADLYELINPQRTEQTRARLVGPMHLDLVRPRQI
jgi:hypothetical protein